MSKINKYKEVYSSTLKPFTNYRLPKNCFIESEKEPDGTTMITVIDKTKDNYYPYD